MSFLKTPKKGLLGASLLLLYLWLGLDRAGTPKGHDLPPSLKATSCKVQAGSEWGRCILESCSLGWGPSEGEYGGSSLKNQDSSPLAPSTPSPQHGQRQRLWQSHQPGPSTSACVCVCVCVCAHEAHTSVCTGVWGGEEVKHHTHLSVCVGARVRARAGGGEERLVSLATLISCVT